MKKLEIHVRNQQSSRNSSCWQQKLHELEILRATGDGLAVTREDRFRSSSVSSSQSQQLASLPTPYLLNLNKILLLVVGR